jgi:curved DNA-binding protein
MKNFYDTLGVAETASEKEIKNAFKALAKKYHPDQGGDENKFKEINEAYDTLKNSEKRQEYDAMRKYGTRGSGRNQQGNDFFSEDIFQDFFSGFGFGPGRGQTRVYRTRPRTNQSVNIRITSIYKRSVSCYRKNYQYKIAIRQR